MEETHVTEPLNAEEPDRPRLGASGPVRVRVPAKINLHLGVGPLRARRLPRADHDLPRDLALRRGHRPPRRPAHADHGGRGRRRAAARRHQPGHPGRPGAGRRSPACPPTPGCTCANRSRSRAAWPAAAPTPPPRWSPATRCGAPACPATSSPASPPTSAPTCRSWCSAAPRSAPAGARRSARCWPAPPPGTGWSPSPTAACPPRRSTASSTGSAPRGSAPAPLGAPDELMAALRQRDPEVLADALGNDLQAAALTLRPELADDAGHRHGRRRARRDGLRLRPDLRLPGVATPATRAPSPPR